MRVTQRPSTAQHCPYCHDDLAGVVLTCSGCQAAFHTECVEEGLQDCPTLGCGTRLQPSILDQPPVVFETPQPPAWFWPLATVAFLAVGLAAIWTAEHRFVHVNAGHLTFRALGWLYTVAGGIGIGSWLHDLGFDLRALSGLR